MIVEMKALYPKLAFIKSFAHNGALPIHYVLVSIISMRKDGHLGHTQKVLSKKHADFVEKAGQNKMVVCTIPGRRDRRLHRVLAY